LELLHLEANRAFKLGGQAADGWERYARRVLSRGNSSLAWTARLDTANTVISNQNLGISSLSISEDLALLRQRRIASQSKAELASLARAIGNGIQVFPLQLHQMFISMHLSLRKPMD
jgi:hypothetical protein